MSTDPKGMELCEVLWNEYEPKLKRICKRKLSSHPSEIDDVIGDAYLALCNAIDNDEDIQNPQGWLYSTVNNLIKLKYTEINKKKKTYINFDSVEQELFYNIDLNDANLSDEAIDYIKNEIFNELLASEQTLFIMIYTKKLKFKEIARIIGSTESAVKQKNYRLKRKIKQLAKEKLKKFN